ncbi:Uncharacterised protein [Campylobacter gracilis]|nr:Uncharacterised protein [Campylobacter gracilis]
MTCFNPLDRGNSNQMDYGTTKEGKIIEVSIP